VLVAFDMLITSFFDSNLLAVLLVVFVGPPVSAPVSLPATPDKSDL